MSEPPVHCRGHRRDAEGQILDCPLRWDCWRYYSRGPVDEPMLAAPWRAGALGQVCDLAELLPRACAADGGWPA